MPVPGYHLAAKAGRYRPPWTLRKRDSNELGDRPPAPHGLTDEAFGALAAGLKFTSLGRRIRATVQNRPLAESAGISTRATDRLTFFIGSGLAGVAGVAVTLMGSISPNLGTGYIINAFLVVVVGGIGQIKGAVIAAFVLGIVSSFAEFTTTASIAQVIVFALIVAFLQVRPQGIYQLKTRSLA